MSGEAKIARWVERQFWQEVRAGRSVAGAADATWRSPTPKAASARATFHRQIDWFRPSRVAGKSGSSHTCSVPGDADRVKHDLAVAGVAGTEEFGRFVSDTRYFEPSRFDERAAMPVLINVLPTLSESRVVDAVAGHLRRAWARPAAFPAVLDAYRKWAGAEPESTNAWHLGDTLGTFASLKDLPILRDISLKSSFGRSRQMIIHSLSRYKEDPTVADTLLRLVDDPGVGLHAMGALRRSVGAHRAPPTFRQIAARHAGQPLAAVAARAIRKAERSIAGRPPIT
jgi:hypothetical protein